jgi:hypothetical protein
MESAKEGFPSYVHGRLGYLYENVPSVTEREIWDKLFNMAKAYFKTSKFNYIMDSIKFDVDSDGEKEYLVLSLGPTSGMYTISLGMAEKGANNYSYDAVYYIYHGIGDFKFVTENEKLYIKYTEKEGETHIFDVVYNGTDILLFENGEVLDMAKITP